MLQDADPANRHWPAEWMPHAATWIAWPHNRQTWPERFEPIEPVFQRIVEILSEVEAVHVLGGSEAVYQRAAKAVGSLNRVTVHPMPTNDCWIRDYGPTFVHIGQGQQLLAVDWQYNAWGGKWPPWDEDAQNAKRVADLAGVGISTSLLTCEGGALETDGEGTLLTTSSCLLSPARNANWSREQVERQLMTQLGVKKVLWIDGGGLAGDDTDSHIDQLVRFTRPGVVVAAVAYTNADENYAKLATQFESLKSVTDAADRAIEIVPLPTPPPRYFANQRVPESYCNFYIANSLVIVPVFGFRETDDAALGILKEQFPKHDIVALNASDLAWGLGAMHCVTQQQPALSSAD